MVTGPSSVHNPPFSPKSPHPAGGFGELGILRSSSPAGSTTQLPGCSPTYPQRLSLCHPGRTPRAPGTAHHGASISQSSRIPAGQSVVPSAWSPLQNCQARKRRTSSSRGFSNPPSSALPNLSGLIRDAQSRPNGMRFLVRKTSICFLCLLGHSLVWFPKELLALVLKRSSMEFWGSPEAPFGNAQGGARNSSTHLEQLCFQL